MIPRDVAENAEEVEEEEPITESVFPTISFVVVISTINRYGHPRRVFSRAKIN